ncbi:2756_t:CDS:2 [Paraglomus occultum]|uniref:2756_t:CDS:1 n=1 Tax=Paraglomus occultum TaxID=144539 RepID=A0A9N9G3Z5_9GLOM|nr:2756_t:CDS:2 [Paraglomus occultum]
MTYPSPDDAESAVNAKEAMSISDYVTDNSSAWHALEQYGSASATVPRPGNEDREHAVRF